MKMTPEQLMFWIHGMLEYRDIESIHPNEAKKVLQGIKDHVALQFDKVTPEPEPTPAPAAIPPLNLDEIIKRHNNKPSVPFPAPFPLPYAPNPLEPNKFWLGDKSSRIVC